MSDDVIVWYIKNVSDTVILFICGKDVRRRGIGKWWPWCI